ncbi:MAG: hypothetical protein OTJ44_01985 [Planctomycetota bacterium]|jgi:ABC-type transport system involved in multi-copper enzyme maturation permease subunit|nr:hypothetical protein [Planctomycetota bacterium]
MTGLWRSFSAELYLLRQRKGFRIGILLVAFAAILRIGVALLLFRLGESAGNGGPEDHATWNFWPQLAHGARTALFFAELLLLGLVAGALPREVDSGAARDPFSRRISRSAFMTSRILSSLCVAILFWLVALGAAWLTASLLFEAGDIMEGGDLYLEESEVTGPIYAAFWHALPPMLALATLATLLSAALRRGVVAAGVCFGLILLPGIFHDTLGSIAPWFFADTLAGFGEDSFLAEAAGFASAIAQAYPADFDAIVEIGWIASWPAILCFALLALLTFRRRPL